MVSTDFRVWLREWCREVWKPSGVGLLVLSVLDGLNYELTFPLTVFCGALGVGALWELFRKEQSVLPTGPDGLSDRAAALTRTVTGIARDKWWWASVVVVVSLLTLVRWVLPDGLWWHAEELALLIPVAAIAHLSWSIARAHPGLDGVVAPNPLKVIIRRLGSNPEDLERNIRLLASVDNPVAVRALKGLADNTNYPQESRAQAAVAAARRGSCSASGLLLALGCADLTRDALDLVRERAAYLRGSVEADDIRNRVADLISEPHHQGAALEAIDKLGAQERHVTQLKSAVSGPQEHAAKAARILAGIGNEEALAVLVDAISSPPQEYLVDAVFAFDRSRVLGALERRYEHASAPEDQFGVLDVWAKLGAAEELARVAETTPIGSRYGIDSGRGKEVVERALHRLARISTEPPSTITKVLGDPTSPYWSLVAGALPAGARWAADLLEEQVDESLVILATSEKNRDALYRLGVCIDQLRRWVWSEDPVKGVLRMNHVEPILIRVAHDPRRPHSDRQLSETLARALGEARAPAKVRDQVEREATA